MNLQIYDARNWNMELHHQNMEKPFKYLWVYNNSHEIKKKLVNWIKQISISDKYINNYQHANIAKMNRVLTSLTICHKGNYSTKESLVQDLQQLKGALLDFCTRTASVHQRHIDDGSIMITRIFTAKHTFSFKIFILWICLNHKFKMLVIKTGLKLRKSF